MAYQARESEARESEARESEARESEARESEARESEARESELREQIWMQNKASSSTQDSSSFLSLCPAPTQDRHVGSANKEPLQPTTRNLRGYGSLGSKQQTATHLRLKGCGVFLDFSRFF